MKCIAEAFSNKLAEATKKLKVGNGLDEDTQVGPIINEKGFNKIVDQINDAIEKGADVLPEINLTPIRNKVTSSLPYCLNKCYARYEHYAGRNIWSSCADYYL